MSDKYYDLNKSGARIQYLLDYIDNNNASLSSLLSNQDLQYLIANRDKIEDLINSGGSGATTSSKFTKDIAITTNVGYLNSSYKTNGKEVTTVFEDMLSKVIAPTITLPSMTISSIAKQEVGTTITPTYTISFNEGKYSYDSTTGVKITSVNITDNQGNTLSATYDTTKGTQSFTVTGKSIDINEGTNNYTITVKINYSAGNQATNNMGNTTTQKISASSCSKTSTAITGYWNVAYYNTFTSETNITQAIIEQSTATTNTSFYMDIGVGVKEIMIVYDTSYSITIYNETVNAYMTFNTSSITITKENVSKTKEYNVATFIPIDAYTTTAKLKITLSK